MTQSSLTGISERQILNMRVKDLPLDEASLPFSDLLGKLKRELRRRGIMWEPRTWASEEWFSPDGVDGFAFPFTLLDPKLVELEKKYVGFCEGSGPKEFLKLARHECAHALDNAFHLRKIKRRQKVFGKSSLPYPDHYIPKPYSKSFVRHLPDNYAQAHPEEDWAETFAVWLGPKRQWRRKYAGWNALEKLLTVDRIMRELKGAPPKARSRSCPLHFKDDERTLKEYFSWKKASLGLSGRNFYTSKAGAVFARQSRKKARSEAAAFLQANEKEIALNVSQKANVRRYVARKMLKELSRECQRKNYLTTSSKTVQRAVEDLLSERSQEFLRQKRHRIHM